jgi:DNA-binding transcriptional regulator YhcF (GntR family)
MGNSRRKRLNTARSVRQELATVYHDLAADKITEGKARTLTYIASILLRALETTELEDKLNELVDKVEAMK